MRPQNQLICISCDTKQLRYRYISHPRFSHIAKSLDAAIVFYDRLSVEGSGVKIIQTRCPKCFTDLRYYTMRFPGPLPPTW